VPLLDKISFIKWHGVLTATIARNTIGVPFIRLFYYN
jgi:hypothetical protein